MTSPNQEPDWIVTPQQYHPTGGYSQYSPGFAEPAQTYEQPQFYEQAPQRYVQQTMLPHGQHIRVYPTLPNGFGTASFVMGAIGLPFSFVPIINLFAFVLGILGLILGAIGMFTKDRARGTAIAGGVFSIFTIAISVLITSYLMVGIHM